MEQIRDRILSYAAAVKEADPAAWVVGPEEWGWSGYIFSGYDQWYGSRYGWGINPDRNAHGGMDYLPWLLSQMKNVKVGVNQNLNVLDVFTVHYYPQGGEFGNDTSTSMQQRRNRSTRSLWDPAYTDESWIADKVRLIPRLKEWVQNYYIPGTPVGVTEYNWGAESHINGATAQADIYGIFGREGLDFGARWTTPDASTPTYKAMRMYRNYDGNKSTFGDVAVGVTAPSNATWDTVAPFAAQRTADGALTIMAISKYLSGSTPVTFNISNFSGAGVAQVWQLTSANSIARLADLTYANGQILTSLPQQSITLFVLPQGSPNTPPTALFSAAPMTIMTGGAVNFDGSASSDPDGSITNYAWTFGDGTSANTPGPLTAHAYAAAGTYQAKLTVMDNRGATAVSSNVTITVNPDPNIINAPSGLTGSSPARSSVKLTWLDNSTNETNFEVHRAPAGTTNFAVVATVAANVKTYQETLPRGTWLYKVRAINATTGKQSAFSNQIQIKTR